MLLNIVSEPGCYGMTFEPAPDCTTSCWHLHRENSPNYVDAPGHVSMPISCLKQAISSGLCKFLR